MGFSRRLFLRAFAEQSFFSRERLMRVDLEQCPLQPEQGLKQGHDQSLTGGIKQPVLRLLDRALDRRVLFKT